MAGLVAGLLLGLSEPAYLIYSVLAIAGGYIAGLEHDSTREGAIRGVVGGTLFGGGILIGDALFGLDRKGTLPDPAILLLVITVSFGAMLGVLGGRRRARQAAAA